MPPFTTRFGLLRAKSRSALATALTSPCTKAMAVGPVSRSWSASLGAVGHGQPDQGVLVDLVVAAGGGQLPAQLGQLGDGEAAVLGQHGTVGGVQAVPHLVDDGDLVGPRIVHGPSAERSAQVRAVDTIEWRRREPVRLDAERLIRRTRLGSLRHRVTGAPEVYGSSVKSGKVKL